MGSRTKLMPAVASKVLDWAAAAPDRPAIVCGGETVTYAQMKARVEAAAGFLLRRGVRPGDRVVLSAGNSSPRCVLGHLAIHLLGAAAVPVDEDISDERLRGIIDKTEPALIALSGRPRQGSVPLESLDSGVAAPRPPATVGFDEPVDILFTAGTTGSPKGVPQSSRNILAFLNAHVRLFGVSESDRVVIPVPISHGYGLGRLRLTLFTGGTAILVRGLLQPADILRAFREAGGNALCCAPAGIAALFRLTEDALREFAGQLRYIETATAPMPEVDKARLARLLPGAKLYESYGATETTGSITHAERGDLQGRRGSVGRPIPGVEIRIMETPRKEAEPGRPGRILVRGETVTAGYWRDPERTRTAYADGWFATNDIGYVDAEGFLFLTGRQEELINVGGFKVAPMEIELALKAHPAIEECACVAVVDPHGITGEAPKAFLELAPSARKPTEEELKVFLRERLESYKIPAQFAWVERIPRTPSGKVQRSLLKGC
ncbi:MAG: acyl--CoA ligase [Elusimicrobia bacterium]|nr:acyl--CoA ligase [Elusimicrobiota bacterium]